MAANLSPDGKDIRYRQMDVNFSGLQKLESFTELHLFCTKLVFLSSRWAGKAAWMRLPPSQRHRKNIQGNIGGQIQGLFGLNGEPVTQISTNAKID